MVGQQARELGRDGLQRLAAALDPAHDQGAFHRGERDRGDRARPVGVTFCGPGSTETRQLLLSYLNDTLMRVATKVLLALL